MLLGPKNPTLIWNYFILPEDLWLYLKNGSEQFWKGEHNLTVVSCAGGLHMFTWYCTWVLIRKRLLTVRTVILTFQLANEEKHTKSCNNRDSILTVDNRRMVKHAVLQSKAFSTVIWLKPMVFILRTLTQRFFYFIIFAFKKEVLS